MSDELPPPTGHDGGPESGHDVAQSGGSSSTPPAASAGANLVPNTRPALAPDATPEQILERAAAAPRLKLSHRDVVAIEKALASGRITAEQLEAVQPGWAAERKAFAESLARMAEMVRADMRDAYGEGPLSATMRAALGDAGVGGGIRQAVDYQKAMVTRNALDFDYAAATRDALASAARSDAIAGAFRDPIPRVDFPAVSISDNQIEEIRGVRIAIAGVADELAESGRQITILAQLAAQSAADTGRIASASDRAEKATRTLNRLTAVLVALTLAIAVLTVVLVFYTLNHPGAG